MADIDNLTDAVNALRVAIQEVGLCNDSGSGQDRVRVLQDMLEELESELDSAKYASTPHKHAARLIAMARQLLAASDDPGSEKWNKETKQKWKNVDAMHALHAAARKFWENGNSTNAEKLEDAARAFVKAFPTK